MFLLQQIELYLTHRTQNTLNVGKTFAAVDTYYEIFLVWQSMYIQSFNKKVAELRKNWLLFRNIRLSWY